MRLRVVLDVFSGRPNPSVELSGNDARELGQALAALDSARVAKATAAAPRLGFRGLIVSPIGAPSPAHDRVTGQYSLGPDVLAPERLAPARSLLGDLVSEAGLSSAERRFIEASLAPASTGRTTSRRSATAVKRAAAPSSLCQCAPAFEPAWWNDGALRQLGNNCYNYATNYRTDTFAQPGRGTGAMFGVLLGPPIAQAALRDGLEIAGGTSNRCPPLGHLVALVIARGVDFHWYRKGSDGMWSHKIGGAPATNLDSNGATIADPRTAARGPYTEFAAFLVCKDGHLKLQ